MADPLPSPPERIPVRRRDRAEDDAWIEAFLERAPVGVLALPGEGGGAPHLNSNLFAYDRATRALLIHTARYGATRDRSEGASPPIASFHAFTMGRLLPADRALEFSVEYEGVTAVGSVAVVDDPEATKRALRAIMDKYAPHLAPERDYESATDADLKRTSVYRLTITRWSGKRKRVPDDFPGAYRYEEVAATAR